MDPAPLSGGITGAADIDLVRFWKDARYRQSLRTQEQTSLPENPVGEVELTEADLSGVTGAAPLSGDGYCITEWKMSTCVADC